MRSWDNLFQPEDFEVVPRKNGTNLRHSPWVTKGIAEKANAIIRSEIEKAPKVYGFPDCTDWITKKDSRDTISARLIDIKPMGASNV